MMNLATIFQPRSASSLTGPSSGFVDMVIGRRTAAGENVTPEKSLTLCAYFACLRVISEDIAKLPLDVYKHKTTKNGAKGKEFLPADPLTALLDAPNPDMTGLSFRETMTQWAAGWGNGYAEIVRNGFGTITRLYLIHPSRVRVVRDEGRITYIVASDPEDGRFVAPTRFNTEDIFHLHGLGSGLMGYSVAALAAETVGASLAAENFGAAFFGQGATNSGILTHPGKLSEPALVNLRESWMKTYGGPKNAHKVAVLQEGVTFTTISIPPEQAQFLQTRQFNVEQVCRWFRVAPHKIQHLLHATFSNIEHQGREHVSDTLLPWARRWEAEIKRQLITRPEIFVAFDFNELTRGDTNARANYIRTMVQTGVITINEGREMEDMDPIDDPSGDAHFIQLNMTTIDAIANPPEPAPAPAIAPPAPLEQDEEDDGEEPPPTEPPAEDDAAEEAQARRMQVSAQMTSLYGAFLSEADRVLTKEVKAVSRAIEKPGLEAWATEFFVSQETYLISAMSPLVQASSEISANVLGVAAASGLHAELHDFATDYCRAARAQVVATKTLPDNHTPAALAESVMNLITKAYA